MEFTRCFGCMRHATTFPCKHCGYDPSRDLPQPYYLRPGVILNGKYVVGKVLGQGGFGITYIGWNLAQNTKVAIKEYFPAGQVMRDSTSKNHLHWFTTSQAKWTQTDGLEKFLKEARKMSRVSNISQVVRVQDLFLENGTAYIVMEFVDGCTLKTYMDTNGTLTWNKAKDIFIPAILSMEKVHQYGIIHRDISPDNIMIQPDGKVKILDLGAAKDLSINSGASSMQVAKPGFSPLEQYQVGGSDTWTDVYAMAATIYYALTGVVPPAAIDRLDAKDPIRWDLPGLRALPKHVQETLAQAMAVKPKDRIQTMDVFLARLQPPNPAPPPGPAPPPIDPEKDPNKDNGSFRIKDNRLWTIVVMCVMVILIILLYLPSKKGNGTEKKQEEHVHTWQSATCSKPKTCTSCGETVGTSLSHNWKQADCTQPKTCSRCGQTVGSALGHQWIAATCYTPKTCSVCGETEGSAPGHDWQPATCYTPKTCSVCGETEGSAPGHDWQPATYDAPKTCVRCGETEGEPLGYLESVDGEFSRYYYGSFYTHKYVFSEPVKGCKDFVLYFEPTFNGGSHVSNWRLLVQDTSGKWHDDYTFTLNETTYCHSFTFSPKMDIQAVAVVSKVSGNYSFTYSLGIYDVHYRN